ncbi:hypothetical protein DY000_02056015 [Brassica cretica]|uniref:Uncharacterized protein n=1 Tax=Brassica cretica TaxID=69181 RepID=A0ABQ7A486_BRACR|nr:hypothetical protein DY000_02056015 [Brassica cretica]
MLPGGLRITWFRVEGENLDGSEDLRLEILVNKFLEDATYRKGLGLPKWYKGRTAIFFPKEITCCVVVVASFKRWRRYFRALVDVPGGVLSHQQSRSWREANEACASSHQILSS